MKLRPVLDWHGGKSFLARHILPLIPDHQIYLEPFAGGLNLLLNKYRSPREIACDLNPELIHLYQYLVDYPEELIDKIRQTPRTLEVFLRARDSQNVSDPLERAANTVIKYRMSRGALGKNFSVSTRVDKNQLWAQIPAAMVAASRRLQGVEFRCQSAFEALEELDGPRVTLYLDPPYYPATRVSLEAYKFELTAFDHVRLLKRIQHFQGNVILSGYDCPLYNKELAHWERHEFLQTHRSTQKETLPQATEIVWVKPHWKF